MHNFDDLESNEEEGGIGNDIAFPPFSPSFQGSETPHVRSGSPTTVVNACGGVALRHNSVVAPPVAHISFPLLLYHSLPFCECISPLSLVFTASV